MIGFEALKSLNNYSEEITSNDLESFDIGVEQVEPEAEKVVFSLDKARRHGVRQKSLESTSISFYDFDSLDSNPGSENPTEKRFSGSIETADTFDISNIYRMDDSPQSPDTSVSHIGEDLCQVCNEKAGKHTAYGGKVCPSCRAFFRRSVQTQYYKIFTCNFKKNCDINSKTRKSCKYCRFTGCIKAKMQISWVLSEKERDRRFNKLRKVSYRNNLNDKKHALSPLGLMPEMTFTPDEQLYLDQIRGFFKSITNPRYENFFQREPECLGHLAKVSYFGGSVDYDLWKIFLHASDIFSQEVLFRIDLMNSLGVDDRNALMRSNSLPVYCFMESIFTDEVDPALCICLSILHGLKLNDRFPVLRYDSIYSSPWAASLEDELRHRHLVAVMKEWCFPDRATGRTGYDVYLIVLMRLIISFSADSLSVKDRDACDKVRNNFSSMLYRYTKKKFGDLAWSKYSQAMEVCAAAFEAACIVRNRLPV